MTGNCGLDAALDEWPFIRARVKHVNYQAFDFTKAKGRGRAILAPCFDSLCRTVRAHDHTATGRALVRNFKQAFDSCPTGAIKCIQRLPGCGSHEGVGKRTRE